MGKEQQKTTPTQTPAKGPQPQQTQGVDNSAALANSGVGNGQGPKPPAIQIYGFRGVRSIEGQPTKSMPDTDPRKQEMNKIIGQNYLLFAGHIGVSVDGGSKIYGLTPQIPEGMDFAQAKDILHAHAAAFPGRVADDKPVFDLADKYAREKGWNTQVTSVNREATPDEAAQLGQHLQELAAMQPGEHGIFYSFPNEQADGNGSFFDDKPLAGEEGKTVPGSQQANCATFPAKVGVKLPEKSGNLRDYMPAMEKEPTAGKGIYGG